MYVIKEWTPKQDLFTIHSDSLLIIGSSTSKSNHAFSFLAIAFFLSSIGIKASKALSLSLGSRDASVFAIECANEAVLFTVSKCCQAARYCYEIH